MIMTLAIEGPMRVASMAMMYSELVMSQLGYLSVEDECSWVTFLTIVQFSRHQISTSPALIILSI